MNFQQFLINNGIHDFDSRITGNKIFGDIYSYPETMWIVLAFVWSMQPEGEDFWVELDSKWRKICMRRGMHFQQFLINNGITDFFDREKSECLIFDKNRPNTWINGRFIWAEQPEGFDFWEDLDKKWLKICESDMKKEFPKMVSF